MKTAQLKRDHCVRRDFYELNDNIKGKLKYAWWRPGITKGIITIYKVNSYGQKLNGREDMLFATFADSPQHALELMGYTLIGDKAMASLYTKEDQAIFLGYNKMTGYPHYQIISDKYDVDFVLVCTDKIKTDGTVRFLEADKFSHIISNESFWELQANSVIEALDKLGLKTTMKEETEKTLSWEESVKKKQDAIWRHMGR